MIRKYRNQAGIVSIMVAVIMMLVISLIVLSFSEISRTGSRNTLDNQLNVSAYYAAESGVNNAISLIIAQFGVTGTVASRTTCNDTNPLDYPQLSPGGLPYAIDGTAGIYSTCVLVDATPSYIKQNISPISTVIPIFSATGALPKLDLNWTLPKAGSGNGGCYPGGSSQPTPFKDAVAWPCDFPVVRIDLTDADTGAPQYLRSAWAANTYTAFFVPYQTPEPGNMWDLSTQPYGAIVPSDCTNASCTAHIKLANPSHKKYYMRVTTIYKPDSILTITASGKTFASSIIAIDSTGRAQDVLRRIRVSVNLLNAKALHIPSAAIISGDSICKQFGVPGGASNTMQFFHTSIPGEGTPPNPVCPP